LSSSIYSLAEVKNCIREVFSNIQDHSTENIGCVHVQWFPGGGHVHFSISDFGIGIPAEIARAYNVKSDAHALGRRKGMGAIAAPA
jgi:anti-sigma regulatory factor (Ser/Thr protein kinase)